MPPRHAAYNPDHAKAKPSPGTAGQARKNTPCYASPYKHKQTQLGLSLIIQPLGSTELTLWKADGHALGARIHPLCQLSPPARKMLVALPTGPSF